MEITKTEIEGLYTIQPYHFEDDRGSFVKVFNSEAFHQNKLETSFHESFYSDSVKGVVRGMHFQIPPLDHAKLVFCTCGEVLDVILDLRPKSATYKQYRTFNLGADNKQMLYIPRGMAHGFCALTDKATLFYFTTSVHSKPHDLGVRYDSFGFDWPVENPIVSDRDAAFPALDKFKSPFI